MNLSFHTAKDLRSRIEILPKGPEWKATPWSTTYPTKKPLTLYYRDPLECLQSLLSNPLIQDFVHFTPFRLWSNSARLMRVYTEWLSGDVSWEIQVRPLCVPSAHLLTCNARNNYPQGPLFLELSFPVTKLN
jgi:Plavaka transposase